MFNKLLSNLPFNPSLINQVSFYSKRLKEEASVRRTGFILVALTMFVQLFAILSPAKPSLAASGNDLIPGGVTSKDQLVVHCIANSYGFKTILAHFSITCDHIRNNSTPATLNAGAVVGGKSLYSMGHHPQGAVNSSTGKATDEVAVNIPGVGTTYMRRLASWDRGAPSVYKAISVGNANGTQYFILFSCGNLVSWGKPTPPPPPPPPPPAPAPKPKPWPCPESKNALDIESCIKKSKTTINTTQNINHANGTTAKAGDSIQYTLKTINKAYVPYNGYVVKEDLRDVLEYADIVTLGNAKNTNGILTWPATNIGAKKTLTVQFTVKLKDPVPKTPEPCNPDVVNNCPSTGSFDMIMTNVYGNTVNIGVEKPIEKTVEITTTKTLTKTGPGTTLIIGFSVTAIAGYFFARSRLMAKELDLVRSEYASGGF